MMLGTKDKAVRPSRPGIYSAAISNFAAPFQTTPSAASRQTTNAVDQQLRGMPSPLGLPKVAAPAAPAAAGPITQMSQAAAANYAASSNQVQSIPSAVPSPAPRTYAEPVIPPDVLQEFARRQSPNMGIQPQGPNLISPQELYQQFGQGDQVAPTTPVAPAGQGGTISTIPASAFQTRTPSGSRAVSAALQAAAARGDWDAVRNHYSPGDAQAGPRGGTIGDPGVAEAQQRNEMFARWGADSALFKLGIGKPGKREAEAAQGAIAQYAALAKQNERTDAARFAQQDLAQKGEESQQRLGIDQAKLGIEQAKLMQGQPGAAGQQLQNQQAQMMMDLTRKAIGGDQEALKQLQALQGKSPKTPQSEALLEILKAWAQGSASGVGNGMPLATMLQEAGPILQMALGMQGSTLPAPQQFVEGQTYLDASGNRARFVGGQWVEVE
jgi:hypothetical protein